MEEGIVDGCFFVWVSVTEKYMKGKDGKMFNNYSIDNDENNVQEKE